MNRFLVTGAVVLVVAVAGLHALRAPLLAVGERLSADMFVNADDADYDPGTPDRHRLPAALRRGRRNHDGAGYSRRQL
jgi:hypothetical protein